MSAVFMSLILSISKYYYYHNERNFFEVVVSFMVYHFMNVSAVFIIMVHVYIIIIFMHYV